jgi:DNA-binding SARP family transcriptional activator/TolB-like protein/Tfp pilus assembly protein PilF
MPPRRSPEVLLWLTCVGAIAAVDVSGRDVLPRSRKARALLAYLALNRGQRIPRPRIAKYLWPRNSNKEALANLRQALLDLKEAMGPLFLRVLTVTPGEIRLQPQAVWVDALAVSNGLDDLPQLNVFSGSVLLDSLDGISSELDEWLGTERQALEERIRKANEAAVKNGRQPLTNPERVEIVRKAILVDPANEEAVRELMQALAAAGHRAQAVEAFLSWRKVLKSRLELEPTEETQQLYEELRRKRKPAQRSQQLTLESDLARRLGFAAQRAPAVLHIGVAPPTSGAKVRRQERGRALDAVERVVSRFHARRLECADGGMLFEFPDTRSATCAAFAVQDYSHRRTGGTQVVVRMGIDIAGDGDHADGLPVPRARLYAMLAGPCEIWAAADARDQLTADVDADIEDLGERSLNDGGPQVRAFRLEPPRPDDHVTQHGRLLPTIAVIPFAPRMSAPEHFVIGEMLADGVIRALSRSESLDVISRLSTTVFRGREIPVNQIGSYLKAHYVLSGHYRTDGQALAIELELADTRSGRIVWSEMLKDEVAAVVNGDAQIIDLTVSWVCKRILNAELNRSRQHPLPTLETYTLLLAAIALMHRNSPEDFRLSEEMLRAVLSRAPRHALPNAWMANWYVLRGQQGWSSDTTRDARQALDFSRRAIDADPDCSLALAVDGLVHTTLLKRLDLGLQQYELAIEANPNDALAWLLRGTLHAFMGKGEVAVADTQRALKLTPLDPHRYFYDSLSATACLAAHQYEQALALANRSLRVNRNKTSSLRAKAIAEWKLGDRAAARQTARRLLELEPNLTMSAWLARSPSAGFEIGKEWFDALRNAGIPE